MSRIRFIYKYGIWHYSKAVRDFLHILGNFIWFFYEFFSIPLLCKTFFEPYRRLDETPKKGFHPSAIFEAVVINVLMRIVGASLRATLILLGFLFIILTAVLGVCLLFVWLLAPLLLLFLVSFGIKLITLA